MKGRKLSLEWKKHIGQANRKANKGNHSSPATEFKKGHQMSYKTKEKLSYRMKKRWQNKEYRKQMSEMAKNNWQNKVYREKISRFLQEVWKNKNLREKQIKAILKSTIKRPTSFEQQIIDVINKYNLPYKYTGNGTFIIGGKNPDFVNINGEKKLLEIGNAYHHIKRFGSVKEYIDIRKNHYKKYGWKSYFLIDDEFNEKKIINFFKSSGELL